MNDHSKISGDHAIVNGNNHKVNTRERLEEYVKKNKNTECGSGFYCIQDVDIAKKYAHRAAKLYGGKPTLNIYRLNHDLITRDLAIAYFNSIEDPRTLEYIGANLQGRFPDFCKVEPEERAGKRPVELCYACRQNCPWAAEYIEAILSDATYSLDDIFVDFWNEKISFQNALEKIYERVDAKNDKLRVQIVLRGKILDIDHFNYLEYVDSVVLGND